jgi:rhomboid protease GluP
VGGVNSHVDNAAHLGGLISGLLIGYIFYYALRDVEHPSKNYISVAISVLLTTALTFFLCTHLRGDMRKYMEAMNRLQHLEAEAMHVYQLPPEDHDKIMITLRTTSIPDWKQCLKILDSCKTFHLPNDIKKRSELIEDYCELRLQFFQLYEKSLEEKSDSYHSEMDRCNQQIEEKLKALNVK